MSVPDPVTPDPRCFSIRLPRPLWIGFTAAVLTLVALGLRIGVPIYQQQVAIREIERLGGDIETRQGGPLWLRNRVGDKRRRLFDEVTRVNLMGSDVTDSALASLKMLPHLEQLRLAGRHVTDRELAYLKGLHGLQALSLEWTLVTDAGLQHVRRLTALRDLALDGTPVTDHGLAQLRGLTGLQTLSLEFTLVTASGLAHGYSRLTKDETKILEALEKPTSVEFVDLTLEDCLAFLKDRYEINIWIDRSALIDEGMLVDQPIITLKLAARTLGRC